MKKASAFVLSLSVLVLVLLSACNNSVEDMLDDYNGKFAKKYMILTGQTDREEVPPSPGEIDFEEGKMLRDEYYMWEDSTLILAGPPKNVSAYRWTVYDPEDNFKIVDIQTVNGSLTTADFVIYRPYSTLEVEHTYKLTLTIRSTGGVEYSDTCAIVVYKHYIFE